MQSTMLLPHELILIIEEIFQERWTNFIVDILEAGEWKETNSKQMWFLGPAVRLPYHPRQTFGPCHVDWLNNCEPLKKF